MARGDTRRLAARIGLVIAASTLLLTASFVGFIAALSGEVTNFDARVPWYLAASALVFVTTIVLLEINDADGHTIIVSALVFGVIGFVLVFLGVEGVVYTLDNTGEILLSRLIIYFVSAALVATGIGYWGLRHWREFTAGDAGAP